MLSRHKQITNWGTLRQPRIIVLSNETESRPKQTLYIKKTPKAHVDPGVINCLAGLVTFP